MLTQIIFAFSAIMHMNTFALLNDHFFKVRKNVNPNNQRNKQWKDTFSNKETGSTCNIAAAKLPLILISNKLHAILEIILKSQ